MEIADDLVEFTTPKALNPNGEAFHIYHKRIEIFLFPNAVFFFCIGIGFGAVTQLMCREGNQFTYRGQQENAVLFEECITVPGGIDGFDFGLEMSMSIFNSKLL